MEGRGDTCVSFSFLFPLTALSLSSSVDHGAGLRDDMGLERKIRELTVGQAEKAGIPSSGVLTDLSLFSLVYLSQMQSLRDIIDEVGFFDGEVATGTNVRSALPLPPSLSPGLTLLSIPASHSPPPSPSSYTSPTPSPPSSLEPSSSLNNFSVSAGRLRRSCGEGLWTSVGRSRQG